MYDVDGQCPCETCAFVDSGTLTCWFMHDVVPERKACTEYMPQDSCLLCSRQRNYYCVAHDKWIANNSHQCELCIPITNLKDFRR